jgi:hypothetical protein
MCSDDDGTEDNAQRNAFGRLEVFSGKIVAADVDTTTSVPVCEYTLPVPP